MVTLSSPHATSSPSGHYLLPVRSSAPRMDMASIVVTTPGKLREGELDNTLSTYTAITAPTGARGGDKP